MINIEHIDTILSMHKEKLTRREFITGVVRTGALLTFASCSVELSRYLGSLGLEAKRDLVTEKYGISRVSWGTEFDQWLLDLINKQPRMTPIASVSGKFFSLEMLDAGLRVYSPKLLDNLRPHDFILVSRLKTVNPKTGQENYPGGMQANVDVCGENVNIIIIAGLNSFSTKLHHEMYHCMDHMDGAWGDQDFEQIVRKSGVPYKDSIPYREIAQCEGVADGYAECYGEWNKLEDRATIAERLMAGDDEFWERMQSDEILNDKVGFVIRQYEEMSAGGMDREFFENLRDGKIGKDFWGYST